MNLPEVVKKIGAENNVILRVLDANTGVVVSETIGHNSATNTMLVGVAHYLKGDGVLNQGHELLSRFVPRYISLGTMGLINQDEDADGLPAGIGVSTEREESETEEEYEIRRFTEYVDTVPGYGADGYSEEHNNDREFFGLGPMYSDEAIKCELISDTFPRSQITYRVILPEDQSELPETVDVVFSAYISTGALAQFRGGRNYIFITETGLWSDQDYSSSGSGLVAGYRITPTSQDDYDMTKAENRQKLKEKILRVGKNQIVQVIWKVQIGIAGSFPYDSTTYRWIIDNENPDPPEDKGSFGFVDYIKITYDNVIINDIPTFQTKIVPAAMFITYPILARPYLCTPYTISTSSNVVWNSRLDSDKGINYPSYMTLSDYCDYRETETYRNWKYMVGDTDIQSLYHISGHSSVLAFRFDITDRDGNPLHWNIVLYSDENATSSPYRPFKVLTNSMLDADRLDAAPGHLADPTEIVQVKVGRVWDSDEKKWCTICGAEFVIDKNNHSGGSDEHPENWLLPSDIGNAVVYVYRY